ncbi:hypothetical protein [Chenggangzhangella methanolivorans]|uniref:Uncharacterized protein n=1 Tax=Chenggangzhangella methanolivorans TaxID=1437009 RepID=A0A9E6RFL4_9HYPH|nr:hypothetical protein [Chenggangzhangella methanolivorans]QZO00396.1 hypothetical protein K6K41_01100 [Chenggangzhangella methanolivorans]
MFAAAVFAGAQSSSVSAQQAKVTADGFFRIGPVIDYAFNPIQSAALSDGVTVATASYAPSLDYNKIRVSSRRTGKRWRRMTSASRASSRSSRSRSSRLKNDLGIVYESHSFSAEDSVGGFYFVRVSQTGGVSVQKRVASVEKTDDGDNSLQIHASRLKNGELALAYERRETVKIGRLMGRNYNIFTMIIDGAGGVVSPSRLVTPIEDKKVLKFSDGARYSDTYMFGGMYYSPESAIVTLSDGNYAIVYTDELRKSGAFRVFSQAGRQ